MAQLKQQLNSVPATTPAAEQTKQSLYNRYAHMLFGYLLEGVKSKQVAEQFLAEIFNELQFPDILAISKPGVNTYCQLQLKARKKLASFTATVDDCAVKDAAPAKVTGKNRVTELMKPEQQHVFCGVHYHGKTMATLAAELNKPEAAIRRILKESFIIIRNQRNGTATIHR